MTPVPEPGAIGRDFRENAGQAAKRKPKSLEEEIVIKIVTDTDSNMPQDVIDEWIAYKTENEVNPVKLRPHPHEFYLYHDI